MIPTLEIDQDGNISTLWTDEVCLYELGTIHSICRASNVDFDETRQVWQVKLLNGTVIHENQNREAAIEEEIRLVGPGGRFYQR